MARKHICLYIVFMLFSSHYVFGQLSITSVNSDFTIDFESTVAGINTGTYDGSGFSPSPSSGQINSNGIIIIGFSDGDLAFSGTVTSGDLARGNSLGDVSTGGIYAFDAGSGDIALGIQPTADDFTTGEIVLKLINNIPATTIRSLSISYNIVHLNNEDRGNSLDFSYSADNSTYIDVSNLNFQTTESSDAFGWMTSSQTLEITGLNIANGSSFYLKWTGSDVSGSDSRDEYGIDDITVNALSENRDLLITEIMYFPESTNPTWEWIELYNNSSVAIDLEGYILDGDDGSLLTASNIGSIVVGSGEAVILASATISDFGSAWGLGIPVIEIMPWEGLDNTGDQIAIWNFTAYGSRNFSNAIDYITYEDASNSWPDVSGTESIYYNDNTFAADNGTATNWS